MFNENDSERIILTDQGCPREELLTRACSPGSCVRLAHGRLRIEIEKIIMKGESQYCSYMVFLKCNF